MVLLRSLWRLIWALDNYAQAWVVQQMQDYVARNKQR